MATFNLPIPGELVFYEKPGCLSNARQKARLVAVGHCLEVRNLLAELWTAERLRPFFGARPVAEWFNPSAPRIRAGEVEPAALSESEALALMVADPLLIRRPLIETAGLCDCGFEPGPVLSALGVELEDGEDLQSCSRGGVDPVCPEVHSTTLLAAAADPLGEHG
ncbi:ArsC/Spx/MgsR family protein [uncultured Thiodictyon sp.]|uniref:ArsC/Spx/MgsR family protein n=1 Tax=uncultured Thiodictyon sp. TaxID=1846217 RepID=UPI0025F752D1|nr:ArsC/Spx/MgsR family protein [uncultured Thiodictyon sp.]